MKKLLSIILIVSCIFTLNLAIVYAETMETKINERLEPIERVKFNEFELLMSLQNISEESLETLGYSSNEISIIKNVEEEYATHLYQMKEWSDNQLLSFGYSNEQIAILRNFDGSVSQMQALGATVDFRLTYTKHEWVASKNRTEAALSWSFNWNGVPLIKSMDGIGFSWNDWWQSSQYALINYTSVSGTETKVYNAEYIQPTGQTIAGAGWQFDATKEDNYYYVTSGNGVFNIYHNNELQDLSDYGVYGHATVVLIDLGITVTFSEEGTDVELGLGFAPGVERMDEDRTDHQL